VGLPVCDVNMKKKRLSTKKLPVRKLPKKKSASKQSKTGPGLGSQFKKTFELKLRFFNNLDSGKQNAMEVAKLSELTIQIVASGQNNSKTISSKPKLKYNTHPKLRLETSNIVTKDLAQAPASDGWGELC
jgi:hypothetical protein